MIVTSVRTRASQAGLARMALHFPRGLVGLESWKDFTLLAEGAWPIMLLAPHADAARVLPVCMAGLLLQGYEFELPDAFVTLLKLQDPGDALVLAILTLQEDPPLVTANLLAPLVVNRRNGLGAQVILENSGYPLRHMVYQGPMRISSPC